MGSDHVLDVAQRIETAERIAGAAGGEIDADTFVRLRGGAGRVQVIDGVLAAAAIDRVATVVAAEPVVLNIAEKGVVEARAANGLDPHQAIGGAGMVDTFLGCEIDTHARRGGRNQVIDLVEARDAVDGVRAAESAEAVVARIAFETVGERRALDRLYVRNGVAAAGAVGRRARGEIDADAGRVGPVADLVEPAVAVDGVVAGTALEGLEHRVGATGEPVGLRRADDTLNAGEGIARTERVLTGPLTEVDRDAGTARFLAVIDRIVVLPDPVDPIVAAVEEIGPRTAYEGVAAVAAK